MRRIRTIHGKYFKVSDCDYEFLRQFRWDMSGRGYFRCTNRGVWAGFEVVRRRVHQMVMHLHGLEYPEGMSIDHIDRNPANNTLENLRFATSHHQRCNQGTGRKPKTPYEPAWSDLDTKMIEDLIMPISTPKGSKYRGVMPKGNRWVAKIKVDYKRIHLGTFDTAEEANKAYQKAKRERDTTGMVTHTPRSKTSKYLGVSLKDNRWVAQIRAKGCNSHIGMYGTEEEASEAYQAAKRDLCRS